MNSISRRQDDLIRVEIRAVDIPELRWSEGHRVSIPHELADLLQVGRGSAIQLSRNGVNEAITVCATRSARALRERRMFTDKPPISSRLPVSYLYVPGTVRRMIARAVGRAQRRRVEQWAEFPGWPLDLSADFAADLAGIAEGRTADGEPTPVILTHDIDTGEGLTNLVRHFLPIEETFGARSANYIVPFGWPIDHSLLDQVLVRGHEIGIHGYDHSNRTPFEAPREQHARLAAALPIIEKYRAAGYRAPSLLRTRQLIRNLVQYYRYDSSIPTSGGLYPVPNNGCASARPFRCEGLWELPITLPRDGSTRFLGMTPPEILSCWMDCAQRIASARGVVCLLTHCEGGFSGNPEMLTIYRRFVEYLAGDTRFFFTTPHELLRKLAAEPTRVSAAPDFKTRAE
jgi:peptidoglycan/xylan/chitin deacetylase (PgdA/CDA1 family)